MDKESGNTEAHSELIQISKVKLFTKIVNGLLLSGLIPIRDTGNPIMRVFFVFNIFTF